MKIVGRFITGLKIGFEIAPEEGIYFHLCLGIFEMIFVNEELFEYITGEED